MVYDHIRNALPEGGSDTLEFEVDLGGYRPPTGGSGHVPNGLYQVACEKARFVASKSGNGINLHLRFRVSGPDRYKGIPTETWIALPVSDLDKDQQERRTRAVQQLIASMASGREGAIEKLVNQPAGGAGKIALTPANLVGQTFWARLEEEEYKTRWSSKPRFFIQKTEYDARPGPDPDARMSTNRPAVGVADAAVTNLADLGTKVTTEATVEPTPAPTGQSQSMRDMLFSK